MAKKWYAMGLRTIEDVRKRLDELDINNEMSITGIDIVFSNGAAYNSKLYLNRSSFLRRPQHTFTAVRSAEDLRPHRANCQNRDAGSGDEHERRIPAVGTLPTCF